jgi:hypothetical protein
MDKALVALEEILVELNLQSLQVVEDPAALMVWDLVAMVMVDHTGVGEPEWEVMVHMVKGKLVQRAVMVQFVLYGQALIQLYHVHSLVQIPVIFNDYYVIVH